MADELIAVAGRIRDFLDELRVIFLAEDFLCNPDDIAGVSRSGRK